MSWTETHAYARETFTKAPEAGWTGAVDSTFNLNLPQSHNPGVFPRMYIASGERLVFETKPSVFAFVNPIGLGLLSIFVVIDLYFLSVILVGPNASQGQLLVQLFGLLFAISLIGGIAGGLLRWRASSYAVTDRRVLRSRGIVSREAIDCPFDKIQNVSLLQGIGARALGYGDVSFQTAGIRGAFGSAARNVEGAGGIYWAGVKDPVQTRRFVEEARDYFLHQTKSQEINEMAQAIRGAIPQVHVSVDQTPASHSTEPIVVSQTAQSPSFFCPRCGVRQVPAAQFCHACGGQLPRLN